MVHKITELCRAKGLSRYKLCEMLDISYESMNRWDKHMPNVYAVYRVAKALDSTVEEILEG